ncbi:MAG: phenylacetate--CoA ligase [Armatimonadetes bacterium]|nr:phenylacetate--CoA ligase [Armatimonadota bacterium]
MAGGLIWDETYECMPRAEIQQLQLERLQATVNRAARNVAFYERQFEELGIYPEDIQTLDDLQRLPLTQKEDLRDSYPYGMFAVPLREVVRIHQSSGTTGRPTVVGYTANDLRHWTELVARNLTAGGVTKDDVVQIFFGYGVFTGGFGFHHGAEAIGASVIPVSHGDTRRQVEVMRDYRTTVIIGTPHYALRIAAAAGEMKVDPHSLSLRIGLFGGEVWDETVRQQIEDDLFIEAFDVYGLSEIGGPGVSYECEVRDGLHIAEDQYLVETIDPDSGEVLPPGEEGELVFTTLNKEAMPLLRYRSGDISRLNIELCPCGRTLARMSRITRHADDRLVVGGINIFPDQVAQAFAGISGVSDQFQLVLDRTAALDRLELHIEVAADSTPDTISDLITTEQQIKERIQDLLGMTVAVKLAQPGSLDLSEGPTRIIEAAPEH